MMNAASFTDFNEIVRRRYEYALGVDTRDWALYRSIFTDEITMDFSDFSGVPEATQPADEWVAGIKPLFSGLHATQHTMTNPIVDVDGETAMCTMYMQAVHFLDNDQGDHVFTLGGYYRDSLVKRNGRWLIAGVCLTVLWSTGNRHIMTLAAQRGTSSP